MIGKLPRRRRYFAVTVPSDRREGWDREIITPAQEQLIKQMYAVNPKVSRSAACDA
jgi:hypothetical protein